MTRNSTFVASFLQTAPAHTVGGPVEVPAGTVIVAFDQVPGSRAFKGYPEAYDEMEAALVPETERLASDYAGGYTLSMPVDELGESLEPIEPLDPRPRENKLPVLSRFSSQP